MCGKRRIVRGCGIVVGGAEVGIGVVARERRVVVVIVAAHSFRISFRSFAIPNKKQQQTRNNATTRKLTTNSSIV